MAIKLIGRMSWQDGRVTGYLQQHAEAGTAAGKAAPLSGLQGAASGVAANLQRAFSRPPPNPFSRTSSSDQVILFATPPPPTPVPGWASPHQTE